MDDQHAVKEALATIRKLRAQLDAERATRSEPIAIIGMGCRFPGGADDPEGFWRLLDDRVDTVTEVPADRWAAGPGDGPEQRAARWGAFVDGVDRFDAAFFGISRREADAMDPQQRLLMEVAWEALERAGQRPRSLSGSQTGVFVGLAVADYAELSATSATPRDIYTVTGTSGAFPAGRLSYALGLHGPSIAVNTACSSSLVALHLACRSLRDGECGLALAGGVNLLLGPSMSEMMASGQALSPDGRCATFDAQANGYVRGEGCGVLVLKRQRDALADGDPVLAVIRGSAVNQDGRSAGLTAPNAAAQQDLVRQALRNAAVDAADVDYVETHGTGTPLGDPIEVGALADVLGRPRPDGSRCILGAVKGNIGHLEAAAGVASVIKAVMALRHERIPANLHLRTPNPRIDLDGTCLALATEPVPWPRDDDRPRLAGVSSFGISGTNAHVILGEAPEAARAAPTGRGRQPPPTVVPLSARTPPALRALASALRDTIDADDVPRLADLAHTAATRRDHLEHRAALVAGSVQELGPLLDAAIAEVTAPGLIVGPGKVPDAPRTVFVFSGQGSQWPRMGRELLATEEAFRTAFEACDAEIRRSVDWSPLAALQDDADPARLERTDVVQPVLFAIGVALAALWRSRGVEPDAVVGHSMGEVAAAHVAGALSLPDAARVICRRSALLHRLRGRGGMVVVDLSLSEADEMLSGYAGRLSVAASNSTRSTVISGDPDALDHLVATVSARDVFCRRVKVDVAAHSPQVDPLLDELRRELRDIVPRQAGVPLYSTVTERVCRGDELDAAYWARNLRAPVLFGAAVDRLLAEGDALFVEISAHPILLPAITDALAGAGSSGTAVASMRRERPAREVLLESLGALYAHGSDVDWPRWLPSGGRCVGLPTYPWQRERHWLEPSAPAARPAPPPGGHPLLGPVMRIATQPHVHLREASLAGAPAYLADHRLAGHPVLPAAACLDMALTVAQDEEEGGATALEDVTFAHMIRWPESDGDRVLQMAIDDVSGQRAFRLFGREPGDSSWLKHASGAVVAAVPDAPPAEALDAIRKRCPAECVADELYERFRARGMEYGPAFRGIDRLHAGAREALGRIALPAQLAGSAAPHRIHPALLDLGLQIVGALVLAERPDGEEPIVPVAVRRVRVLRAPGERAWAHVRLVDADAGAGGAADVAVGDLRLLDDDGEVLVELSGIRVRVLAAAVPAERWGHTIAWRSVAAPEVAAGDAAGTWIVLADRTGVAGALTEALARRGGRCVTVRPGSGFTRHGDDRYELEVSDAASWAALLGDVGAQAEPCRALVHLSSLDATPSDDGDAATVAAEAPLAALALAQAALGASWRDAPHLCLVTRGAQAVGAPGPVAVSQAGLWGFARTLAMEHPELSCKRLDLDPGGSPDEAARAVLAELLASDGEDEVAVRSGERHAARLVRAGVARPAAADPVALRGEGTYLVTGGLGGLGLRLAEWLVSRGARHLVLLGRSGATPAAQPALERLRASGAEIVAAAADVARREDLAGVLADVDARTPPLAGVLHLAMVLDDSTVLQLDAERFTRVFSPKARGAWNLHALTRDRPLDLFVLYSSAAALIGSPGQANYAAANAFLGALAHHRRAAGLPALCIDWGLFSEAGIMAGREAAGERLGFRGIGPITPAQGLAALERLLADPPTQIGMLDFDVRRWFEFYPAAARSPLLGELDRTEPPTDGAHAFRAALETADPAGRRALLADFVAEQLGRTLRIDPARIDRSTGFANLGLDSLMGLELRNRLEAGLGARLSVALLFASPTVDAVADHLDEKLATTKPEPAATPDRPPAVAAADLEQLDTDDVLALIDSAIAEATRR